MKILYLLAVLAACVACENMLTYEPVPISNYFPKTAAMEQAFVGAFNESVGLNVKTGLVSWFVNQFLIWTWVLMSWGGGSAGLFALFFYNDAGYTMEKAVQMVAHTIPLTRPDDPKKYE